MLKNAVKGSLLATTVIAGMAFAVPAHAQVSTPQTRADQATSPAVKPATDATTTKENADDAGTIVVTGSILRRTSTETPSPVTIITTESLDQRGISTVQDGLQALASNNGPALTNSFTANGAFAGGASAVSLRGLSTNSTLVLFDGLRGAYYPLADDGARNFVDLNTIPDDIIERVEVLRDGASSSYGADAIAGVVNIITKRQFTGIQARGEAGVSSRGDAPEHRLSLTAGVGDLKDKGFNAYISGFYYDNAQLFNRDRPYPFNTDNLQNICYKGTCGPQNVVNGLDPNGNFPVGSFLGNSAGFYVRPYDAANTAPQGGRQLLGNSCLGLTTYNLTPAERADNPNAPATVCQADYTNLYGVIQPSIHRFGLSGRATVRIGDTAEAYAEVNFLQTKTAYDGAPTRLNTRAPAGIDFKPFSTGGTGVAFADGSFPLTLPVYVCAGGVGSANGLGTGCTAANGTLNPNNPFAAQGQLARVTGRFLNLIQHTETRNRAYRFAVGIKGSAFSGWDYNVEATGMHEDLQGTAVNFPRIQNVLDAIARGTINFADPSQNTTAQYAAIAPTEVTNDTSDLYQAQATVTHKLMELSGGALQLGLGAAVRYEAVNDPSGNTDVNGATQRYFVLNAFGAKGHRYVYSTYAELDAPITRYLDVNLSGRYDKYSSGQKSFSPKIGVKFTPIRELALRGTYSRGFRIPSFAEANALPTTGYVTASSGTYNDTFLAQYGCSTATFTTCPAYVRNAAIGETTVANANLKPEKSRSFTAGLIFEPRRNVSFTVDFYDIKKSQAIAAAAFGPVVAGYYAGQPTPVGYVVTPDSADPNNPNAKPVIAFVEAPFINANTIHAQGIDFGASARFRFGAIKYNTSLDASYIRRLSTSFPDGHVENYPGTLGNFNLTAGSGTPRWHGNWENTLDFGHIAITGTANYFGGYNLSAEDQTGSGTAGKCGLSDGSVPCNVKPYITFDAVAQVKIGTRYNLYLTMLNVFNRLPPLDPVTYGAHLYNPVQGGQGILGRYFKAGVKLNF